MLFYNNAPPLTGGLSPGVRSTPMPVPVSTARRGLVVRGSAPTTEEMMAGASAMGLRSGVTQVRRRTNGVVSRLADRAQTAQTSYKYGRKIFDKIKGPGEAAPVEEAAPVAEEALAAEAAPAVAGGEAAAGMAAGEAAAAGGEAAAAGVAAGGAAAGAAEAGGAMAAAGGIEAAGLAADSTGVGAVVGIPLAIVGAGVALFGAKKAMDAHNKKQMSTMAANSLGIRTRESGLGARLNSAYGR